MSIATVVYVLIFWVMQVIAQLFFKWGSEIPGRWMWGFLAGNAFGFSSIWILMMIYKAVHPNIALGIAGGGTFLACQIALAFFFRTRLAPLQWGGIAAIVFGMLILAAGGRSAEKADAADGETASQAQESIHAVQ